MSIKSQVFLLLSLFGLSCLSGASEAAEVIFPDLRSAYTSDEPIELAVAGRQPGQSVTLTITPQGDRHAEPVDVEVPAEATAVTLPPYALAPGKYSVSVDGKAAVPLTIATGVDDSTLLVSQTSHRAPQGAANFIVGNSFLWGRLTPDGKPTTEPRGRKSQGFRMFEEAIAQDLPISVYMYWTGYVTHKPWGTNKSWVDDDMQQAMRLLSLANAQRLRRFGRNIVSVGPIDEPGLGWGPTPGGGMASGFPDWDEAWWYEKHGWKFTDDIASQSDQEWLKYIDVRTDIIRDSYERAKADHRSVWPDVVWSGDLYAPHALMDGCDPANQKVNDIPATHVFFDWSGGPMSVPGQLYLEKATRPTAKLAHAMNGQLDGNRGNMPPLYDVLMNAMLQGGLQSNWWLNTGGMKAEDLTAVNGRAKRWGPLFLNFGLQDHDVAILYSLREHAMRQQPMARLASQTAEGKQPKLLLPLPEGTETGQVRIDTNAYEVGSTYVRQILGVHQALRRAGYPAHVIEDTVVPELIGDYQVLVITGQTHPLAPEVQQAIETFIANGGEVVVDESTTIDLPQVVTHQARLGAEDIRAFTYLKSQKAKTTQDEQQASRYRTNRYGPFGDQLYRDAVEPIRQAMKATKGQPVVRTDAADLSVERHVAGEGQLLMVLNGHEELPARPAGGKYAKYNYAPYQATFALQGLEPGRVVFEIAGRDWSSVQRVRNPGQPIQGQFDAGEMKLYLVAPREPAGIEAQAESSSGHLRVTARLQNVKMPWPIHVTLTDPQGTVVYTLSRSFDADGTYRETLPTGRNAPAGRYTLAVNSPVGQLKATATVEVQSRPAQPRPVTETVRLFDEEALRRCLSDKPQFVIALAGDEQKQLAGQLAKALAEEGIQATIQPEDQAVHKVQYPRVWNPYLMVYSPDGDTQAPKGEVAQRLQAGLDGEGRLIVKNQAGETVSDWQQPKSLVTVIGQGLLNWRNQDQESAYEPGVQLYVDQRRQVQVLNGQSRKVKTTEEVQEKWSRPWQRLTSYVGGYQLPPQLPEAYTAEDHLIVLGDSRSSKIAAVLQASEILPQIADEKYPGPGRALVSFVRGPFHPERHVLLIAASDPSGLQAGVRKVTELVTSERPGR